jgi:predicted ATPase
VPFRRWNQAKRGEGQVVLLWGEAGIGKSRIAHALCERVATEAHTQLCYQCSPFHSNSTLYPIINHIEHAAKFGPRDTPQKKLAKLRALMPKAAQQVEDTVPLIAALLSIPMDDRCHPSLTLSPQQQKARTLAALVDQMEGLATHELVLVVLEDAQWMDPTTRELLDLSVQRAQSARALIIVTFRSDARPPWSEHAPVRLLALNRLSECQSAELVRHVAGNQLLPRKLVEQIVAKTDGVPLSIEELTKTLLSSGLVQNKRDRPLLNNPVIPLAIPTTLQDSLMARLDQLSPVKRVAQIGAAIGREFSYQLLAAVSELSEADLISALNRLTQAELIIQRGLPPDAHYSFKHALVQDAAYESLLRSTRHELHARIAHVLETEFPQTAELEPRLLAHHHALAGFFDRAITYLRRTSQQALAQLEELMQMALASLL